MIRLSTPPDRATSHHERSIFGAHGLPGTLCCMTPEELSAFIRTCLNEAIVAGEVDLDPAEIGDVKVERPRSREHGRV